MDDRLKRWMRRSGGESETEAEAAPVRAEPVEVTDADFRRCGAGCGSVWCLSTSGPTGASRARSWRRTWDFLLEAYGDRLLVVAALDVEENPATSERFGVQGLPTLIFFQDGEEIDRQLGVVEYEALRERVEGMLGMA